MKIYEAIEYIRVNKGIRYDSTIAKQVFRDGGSISSRNRSYYE